MSMFKIVQGHRMHRTAEIHTAAVLMAALADTATPLQPLYVFAEGAEDDAEDGTLLVTIYGTPARPGAPVRPPLSPFWMETVLREALGQDEQEEDR